MIYGGTAHLTPSAIGGALTYSKGQGKVRIREDRLPIPMTRVRFQDGSSLTVLDAAPRGDTTAADSHDLEVSTLVEDRFEFGSVGVDDSRKGELSVGFWFPGTEGEITYRGNTYPGGQVHAWRSRFHPLKQGLLQAYRTSFRFGQKDFSLPDFYSRDW
jgi:hypothetical protein